MARQPPSIQATSTLAMVRAAEARGVRTAALLRQAGVSREALEEPDARLPASTVMAIWTGLREQTGDAALQLYAPAALPWGAYRVIDYLVATSPSVGDGVRRFARYFGIISETVRLRLVEHGRDHDLVLEMGGGAPVPYVYVDYVFAALVTRVRLYIRPGLAVHAVSFRQPRPADPTPWESVFQAPVSFGAPADRLRFSDAEWNAPTVQADEALALLLEEHARMIAPPGPEAPAGFTAEVLEALASALPEGGSAARVARSLHVSVRTLQRKLEAEGTTFSAVLETARSRLARTYLSNPRTSTAEVAFLLGFSDPSSFNRAFRRWTGTSPGRWRRGG